MALPFPTLPRHVWWILSLCAGICGWLLFDGNPTTKTRLAQYGWPCQVQATGSTATVFRCLAVNGTMYAMKRYRKRRMGVSEAAYVDSIKNEVRLAATIPSHPQILEILDFFAEDDRWYMVMPYVSTTLFDHTIGDQARALSADEVDCIFYQLVNGVAFLHQQRVVHLDLKLNNILITQDGEVKIIDFGQAQFVGRSAVAPSLTDPLGTPPNVPWEAYHGQGYDPFAADAWAVGIIYCQSMLPTVPWNLGETLQNSNPQFSLFASTPTPNGSQSTTAMDRDQVQATVEMILRHLPLPSRPLIGQLLDSDPANRVTAVERAFSDAWFQSLQERCPRSQSWARGVGGGG
ncbi:checkpoint kinase [Aspergillus bertholletiae]|uniref:Checkpoint kinase n=1 Tax=Aspergillus bertholletiae TaxID=1226010 RepID=A0A5N7AV30_9EURO|nr:checkpoint kinase [Aspergillus bertholletiae]